MIDATQVSWSYVGSAVLLLAFWFVIRFRRKAKPPSEARPSTGGLLTGADGRRSTSKATAFGWTLILVYIFGFMAVLSLFPSTPSLVELLAAQLQDEYLFLLGGPFVALVAAKGIVSAKVADGTLQKVDQAAAADTKNVTGGITTDDSGSPDLVDLQYLGFNIVAAFYVVGYFVVNSLGLSVLDPAELANDDLLLASIPPTLFALTSASALTYVGNKAAVQNRPAITGFTPNQVRPGGRLAIHGQNFVPAGAPQGVGNETRGVEVQVGDKPAPVVVGSGSAAQVSTTQIVAYVPLDAPEGSASVSVTTAANAVTEAKEVQVVADTPEILRLAPARAAPGTKVRVLGKFLDPPALAGASDGKPAITLDGTSVPTTMDVADKSLTFEVPKGKSVGDDVQVRVQRVDGKESPPEELTVVDPPVTP